LDANIDQRLLIIKQKKQSNSDMDKYLIVNAVLEAYSGTIRENAQSSCVEKI